MEKAHTYFLLFAEVNNKSSPSFARCSLTHTTSLILTLPGKVDSLPPDSQLFLLGDGKEEKIVTGMTLEIGTHQLAIKSNDPSPTVPLKIIHSEDPTPTILNQILGLLKSVGLNSIPGPRGGPRVKTFYESLRGNLERNHEEMKAHFEALPKEKDLEALLLKLTSLIPKTDDGKMLDILHHLASKMAEVENNLMRKATEIESGISPEMAGLGERIVAMEQKMFQATIESEERLNKKLAEVTKATEMVNETKVAEMMKEMTKVTEMMKEVTKVTEMMKEMKEVTKAVEMIKVTDIVKEMKEVTKAVEMVKETKEQMKETKKVIKEGIKEEVKEIMKIIKEGIKEEMKEVTKEMMKGMGEVTKEMAKPVEGVKLDHVVKETEAKIIQRINDKSEAKVMQEMTDKLETRVMQRVDELVKNLKTLEDGLNRLTGPLIERKPVTREEISGVIKPLISEEMKGLKMVGEDMKAFRTLHEDMKRLSQSVERSVNDVKSKTGHREIQESLGKLREEFMRQSKSAGHGDEMRGDIEKLKKRIINLQESEKELTRQLRKAEDYIEDFENQRI